MTNLFDWEEAQRRAERGGERAASVSGAAGWLAACDRAIKELCRWGGEFTTDDVLVKAGEPPEGVRAQSLGPRMKALVRDGTLEQTRYLPSSRVASHGRKKQGYRRREETA